MCLDPDALSLEFENTASDELRERRHGFEDLSEIYGESLSRLRPIKKQYAPYNRFHQWSQSIRMATKASASLL